MRFWNHHVTLKIPWFDKNICIWSLSRATHGSTNPAREPTKLHTNFGNRNVRTFQDSITFCNQTGIVPACSLGSTTNKNPSGHNFNQCGNNTGETTYAIYEGTNTAMAMFDPNLGLRMGNPNLRSSSMDVFSRVKKKHAFTFAIIPLRRQSSKWAPAASLLPTIAASSAPAIRQCLAGKYPHGASDFDPFLFYPQTPQPERVGGAATSEIAVGPLIWPTRSRKVCKAEATCFARRNDARVPRCRFRRATLVSSKHLGQNCPLPLSGCSKAMSTCSQNALTPELQHGGFHLWCNDPLDFHYELSRVSTSISLLTMVVLLGMDYASS